MPKSKGKKTIKRKTVETNVLVKTEITALATLALFVAAIPLAILIGLWSVLFAILFIKAT